MYVHIMSYLLLLTTYIIEEAHIILQVPFIHGSSRQKCNVKRSYILSPRAAPTRSSNCSHHQLRRCHTYVHTGGSSKALDGASTHTRLREKLGLAGKIMQTGGAAEYVYPRHGFFEPHKTFNVHLCMYITYLWGHVIQRTSACSRYMYVHT